MLLHYTPGWWLQACPEKAVFDGVMLWAGYGRPVEDASSPCHPLEVRWGLGSPASMHRTPPVPSRTQPAQDIGPPGMPSVTERCYSLSPPPPLQDLDQLLPSIRFPLLQDAELEDVR